MKTYILIFSILFSSVTFSQNELYKFDHNGLQPNFLVGNIDSLSQNRLYEKTINWIKETYHTPDEVIKSKIENEKVRFEGIKKNGLYTYGLGMQYFRDVKYMIEISFKNGRFKFQIDNAKAYWEPSEYSSGGWLDIKLGADAVDYYKEKRGDFEIKKQLRDYPEQIENIFNPLYLSLYNYLNSNMTVSDEDDW